MKHAFLLTGSNAAGKTTSVEKALEPWYGEQPGEVPVPRLDHRIMSIRADNDGRFKGDAQDQRRVLTELWLSEIPILMVEGTRINTPIMDVYKKFRLGREEEGHVGTRGLTVLMALQTAEVMRAHLVDRCMKKGKAFRMDYWDYNKLNYEGMRRYPTSFRKNGITPVTFQIDREYKICDQIVEFLQTKIREVLGE